MTRQPSEADFAELVTATWPALYRTAYLLLGDHQLAEDLVQTALAKTYASWSSVRDAEAAHVYARVVLVNTATSWFRRRSWRREQPTERLPDGAAEDDASLSPPVVDALRQLPPRQRAVVVLRFYDDLSVRDTAGALGVSEGTVKSQTSDALTTLRRLLGDAVLPVQEGTGHD